MCIAIKNARVFDGREIVEDRRVVIDHGLISDALDAAEAVDAAGCTLLPGLIDSHTHLYEDIKYLQMAAEHGITTMLDMGMRNPTAVENLRNLSCLTSVKSSCGMIFASGSKAPKIMNYPESMVVQNERDAARIVGEQVDLGADYIKLILEEKGLQKGVNFPLAVGRAVVEQAHERNKLVIAHAVTNKTFRSGIGIGVDVLTHIPFTEPIEPELIEAMAAGDITIIPTLIMGQCLINKLVIEHPLLVKIKVATDRLFKGKAAFDFTLDMAKNALSMLYKAGVRILAGTDSNMDDPLTPASVPYGKALHDELQLFVETGMTPLEALQSATSKPAEYFGLTDRGRIAPGLRADLLLVKGNPFLNIEDLRNVEKVWIKGDEVAI